MKRSTFKCVRLQKYHAKTLLEVKNGIHVIMRVGLRFRQKRFEKRECFLRRPIALKTSLSANTPAVLVRPAFRLLGVPLSFGLVSVKKKTQAHTES